MNRKPKQSFDADLKQAVIEYHEWHHDRDIDVKAFICDPTGLYPVIHTRVTDEQGNKKSILLQFDYHYDHSTDVQKIVWDISELFSCDRKDELEMLEGYMGGADEE